MLGLGVTELVFILVLLVLFFGASRIPLIAKGLGGAIRNFKGELRQDTLEDPDPEEKALPPTSDDP